MNVKLTRITGDPILAIEEAASNCYDSNATGDGKILKHCVKSGHNSVTEFCNFTFHISGVSRALLAQLTRHRHASFAVRSQRYCNEDGFKYVIPPSILNNPDALDLFYEFMLDCQGVYTRLQSMGIENEDARYVLPNACETILEVEFNLRSLMNFMNERLCKCAQWEIRELAKMMRQLIIEQVPLLADYLVPKCEKHGKEFGFCLETKQRRDAIKCYRHPRLVEVFEGYDHYKDLANS